MEGGRKGERRGGWKEGRESSHITLLQGMQAVCERRGPPHLSAVCRYTEARYFSTASPTNSAASRLKGSQAG